MAHGLRRSSGRQPPVACGDALAPKVAPGSCSGRAQRVTHLSTGPKGPIASGLSTAVDYLWCGLSAVAPTVTPIEHHPSPFDAPLPSGVSRWASKAVGDAEGGKTWARCIASSVGSG